MANINAFTGVGVAGMSRTLHAAAAIPTQRKRRTATATGKSVDRGTI
jgi:hypothetical protein